MWTFLEMIHVSQCSGGQLYFEFFVKINYAGLPVLRML